MVRDLVACTREAESAKLCISPQVEDAMWKLRDFLYENVYDNPEVHGDFIKAEKIIEDIYTRLMENDPDYQRLTAFAPEEGDRAQKVADYIAGMTDHYAMQLYQDLFWPRPWAGK
jgi:dGTPase